MPEYAAALDTATLDTLNELLEQFTTDATKRTDWLKHLDQDAADYFGPAAAEEHKQAATTLRLLRKATRASSKLVQTRVYID